MSNLKIEKLKLLQRNQKNIRNICILAHVDHGKTTLADALIASNGIISNRLAGKLRYMDSREDEQTRGITMKSSAIALYYNTNNEEFLINLIDSPGHIDFGGEVSAAVRLCDSALIIVDVVEGICPQTYGALKQAWLENLNPVLVLNKIDRLIIELKMTTEEAEKHLIQILERVNAIMGELFTIDVLAKYAEKFSIKKNEIDNEELSMDYTSLLEDKDDSLLYFSTEHSNVVFASAIDGWGFRVEQFSSIYAKKVGINAKILNKTLWGDFYLCAKSKSVKRDAKKKGKKSLFVQLILDNIWKMYDVILEKKNKELIEKIITSLNLSLKIRGNDWRGTLYNIFNAWLPLSQAILEMVCEKCPNPCEISDERCNNFIRTKDFTNDSLPPQTIALKHHLKCSSSNENAPVIIFISKMFQFDTKLLPKNRPKILTIEEMSEKKQNIKNRLAEKNLNESTSNPENLNTIGEIELKSEVQADEQISFIAFGRIFSGTIKKGQELFILGPRHKPHTILNSSEDEYIKNSSNVTRWIAGDLYLMMGKELEELECVPSGNIVGIGGLDDFILKSATISSTIFAPPFSDVYSSCLPIMRVAVQPRYACNMDRLSRGLKLLSQSDPSVEVVIEDSGEHLLIAAGEIHLQKCLHDLTTIFAKIEINVSPPNVAFRETIIVPPTFDRVNESISEQFQSNQKIEINPIVEHQSVDGLVTISVEAVPIPEEIYQFLQSNCPLIKLLLQHNQNKFTTSQDKYFTNKDIITDDINSDTNDNSIINCQEKCLQSITKLSDKATLELLKFKKEFSIVLNKAGKPWCNYLNNIWSFGPKKNYTNILINEIKNYERPSMWEEIYDERCERDTAEKRSSHWDTSIISGFHLSTSSGPMCEETMSRVCFVVRNCSIKEVDKEEGKQNWHCVKGLVISTMKECCRRAFQQHPQRLMWPMYSCIVQASVEVLGCVYSVINRRLGVVVDQDMEEGSTTFKVSSFIPVIESFGFGEELRKKTSGLALPQLKFSHWQILEMDPYWVPTTEEELLHFGEKADSANAARTYLNNVRRRKGLAVDEKIVQFAEKQRTLTKNK